MTPRLPWLLWLAVCVLFLAVWFFPLSNFLLRSAVLALFLVAWPGLVGLCWRRRVLRFALLGAAFLLGGFLAMPARHLPPPQRLRQDYVAGLGHYNGVAYYWGGESPKGIDCSGLVRRGLINSLFYRGVRTLNPGLVRRALWLWWHDCTARDLGGARDGFTIRLLETPGINQLDHSRILPGDLAVTENGVHVMAYLGSDTWIEADPVVGRVISVPVPASDNLWFNTPMRIVRWGVLSP